MTQVSRSVLLADITTKITDNSAGDISWDDVKTLLDNLADSSLFKTDDLGKQTVGVGAGGFNPTPTGGCAAVAEAETTTNDIPYQYLAFDPTSVESAYFWMPTPKGYDAGVLQARVAWTHPSTTTNFGVVWQVEILALSNDDAIDTAFGTAVTIDDTGGTTEDFYLSPDSGDITPGNTVAKRDWLCIKVSRLATDGDDTMTVDAHMTGFELYFNRDALKDD